jgi:hypothetical protein
MVSQILLATSVSLAVSNKLAGLVFRNIPSSGDTMNSRIKALRRIRNN